jgi:uncharacterized protein (TIGR02452 family)
MSFNAGSGTDKRNHLRKIAEETLDVIKHGSYILPTSNVCHDLRNMIEYMKSGTKYYAADSFLSTWSHSPAATAPGIQPEIWILEESTICGVRLLSGILSSLSSPGDEKIGILNFASAKYPGGGFINGAQAQEESLARSSTLYPSLMTHTAQQFYSSHKHDPRHGFYSHAMVYSPGVVFFRDDDGGWTKPLKADVLVSAAVNAGEVRRAGKGSESRIESVMRERMGRVLFLFSQRGVRNLVLGSFGTGVFRNNVETIARIWAELLVVDGARFKGSFDRVVFAILGKQTFDTFDETFKQRARAR